MEKGSITIGNESFIVRTLDIRSIPRYGEERFKSVDVAERSLWTLLSNYMRFGDKYACRIDETIFCYIDTELMRRDATDEELIEYIRTH